MNSNEKVTEIALFFIGSNTYNKKKLSEELGISRPTLDSRISGESKWKKLEVKWLNVLHDEHRRIVTEV